MIVGDALRRSFGFAALGVFVVMALVLNLGIGPYVDFLPQAEFKPYSDAALQKLSEDLRSAGVTGLYTVFLLFVDVVFIVLYALWAGMSQMKEPAIRWRLFAVAVTLVFVVFDLSEDGLLAYRLGLLGTTDAPNFTDAVSLVHYVTLAKYMAFAGSLVSAILILRSIKS